MKFKVIPVAVATSLATAGFVDDLMASFSVVGGIATGKPGNVDTSGFSSESNIVVVQGYPEVEAEDEDADLVLFQAGYFAYGFKIVSLIVIAKDRPTALRKANVFKKAADEFVLARFPNNDAGKLHVSDEPISNAAAVSLASNAEIVLTLH